jgi:hypothetical protein
MRLLPACRGCLGPLALEVVVLLGWVVVPGSLLPPPPRPRVADWIDVPEGVAAGGPAKFLVLKQKRSDARCSIVVCSKQTTHTIHSIDRSIKGRIQKKSIHRLCVSKKSKE